MFATLFTQVPAIYRILAILALIVAVFGYGYTKGVSREHDRFAASEAKSLQNEINAASKLNKILRDQLLNEQAQQSEMDAKNAALSTQLGLALMAHPAYSTLGCAVTPDVSKDINDLIGNSWRVKK